MNPLLDKWSAQTLFNTYIIAGDEPRILITVISSTPWIPCIMAEGKVSGDHKLLAGAVKAASYNMVLQVNLRIFDYYVKF